MTKRPTFEEFKKKALKKPGVKAAYDALQAEFEVIDKMLLARKKARYSQKALAKKMKVQQPAIARLERGGYANTSISRLTKYADALGYNVKVSLTAKKRGK